MEIYKVSKCNCWEELNFFFEINYIEFIDNWFIYICISLVNNLEYLWFVIFCIRCWGYSNEENRVIMFEVRLDV